MTLIEAVLITFMPTVFAYCDNFRITSQNLGNFQVKYLWWSSGIVKSSSLRFTLILVMIPKPMIS